MTKSNRIIYSLFLLFIFFSCEKEIEYYQNLELVWESRDVNWNASSLIVDNNFIYGNTMNDSIFKLDLSNGSMLWKRYSRGTYANSKPIINNNTIFVGGADKLQAFDNNGNLHWIKSTNTKTIGLIIKDSILFNTRTNQGLFAIDIKNGKELWNIKPDYQMLSISNPTIKDSLLILGNFNYIKGIGSHLACINIEKQNINWEIENSGFLNGPAVIENEKIIFSSDSIYKKGFTYKIDLFTGKPIWKTETNPVTFYESKILKNKVFVPSYENGIICLNKKTGETFWKLNEEFYPNTELIIHKNILFFGTTKREFIGVNENGEIAFKSSFEYGIGNPFIYNNNVYVNDGNGKLFKIKNTVNNTL